jgi:hypothetical protein
LAEVRRRKTSTSDVLPRSIDFVFIDADKPNYAAYYDAVIERVRPGGIICADNTVAWGEIANAETEFEPQNVRALQAYNDKVTHDPARAIVAGAAGRWHDAFGEVVERFFPMKTPSSRRLFIRNLLGTGIAVAGMYSRAFGSLLLRPLLREHKQ